MEKEVTKEKLKWSRVLHPEHLPAVLHLLVGAPHFLNSVSKGPRPLRSSVGHPEQAPHFLKGASKDPRPLWLSVHPEQAPHFLKGASKDPRPLWLSVVHPEQAPHFLKGASKDPRPLWSRLRLLLRCFTNAPAAFVIVPYVVVLSLLVSTSVAFSQHVTVNASVDSQSVVIGDWIRYSVEVKHPSSLNVTLPVFKDTMGLFDIVMQDSLLRTEENGEVVLKKDFTIAKYDAGSFYIQPYSVQYKNAEGKTEFAHSNPIPVEIRGVDVDTSQTIKDVKAPLTVPLSAEEVAVYVGIAVAIGGIAYGIYYYVKKRKRSAGDVQEQKKPNIPPHVLAMMQLEELEAKRLWQAGEIKAYYSEATEIVRRYFELRYGIMALEMTTGEVMMQLEQFKLQMQTTAEIESLLSGADLVKFAKYQPVAAENEQVIAHARSIVEKTMPEKIDSQAAKVQTQETVIS